MVVSIDEHRLRLSPEQPDQNPHLDVTVHADGQVYRSYTRINDVWDKDSFYFKAGAYLGVNETQARGIGQTSFYALSFTHSGKAAAAPSASSALKGTDAHNVLSGKGQKDTILGYGGNDKLYGKGGNDILTGGKGKDAFVFDTKPNSKLNRDVIKDFKVKDDSIYLNDSVYKALKHGRLSSAAFVTGDKAKDANDRIIYNKKTGALFYDADGVGSTAAIQFAKVSKGLSLTAADFFII
jgi:Ca2+-binding RTX toxin-like protein